MRRLSSRGSPLLRLLLRACVREPTLGELVRAQKHRDNAHTRRRGGSTQELNERGVVDHLLALTKHV
jgi:hypothetical protein